MKRPLHVLVVEDSDDDAELVLLELRRGGFDPLYERVQTEDGMRASLGKGRWDVVISDYSMPQFSGLGALKVLQATGLDVPFILVSGTVGEDVAVEAMKSGANDYLLKDQLVRLAPAVNRELRDAQLRAEGKQAEAERDQLLDELQQAVRARDEFLSIASHELKTPLTSLQLQVQSLERWCRNDREPLNAVSLTPRLDVIKRQTERLTNLINNLLDVSRITSGRMELRTETMDLALVVREVVARLQESTSRAGCRLSLQVEGPMIGRWDRMRVEQVVVNLISNAIKYGAGKPLDVTLRKEGHNAALSVRDQGIGIAPRDQERIFGRFERAVSEHHYGGLGMGLWIVRQIVDAHHGQVKVQSAEGEGATFTVELPLAEHVQMMADA